MKKISKQFLLIQELQKKEKAILELIKYLNLIKHYMQLEMKRVFIN